MEWKTDKFCDQSAERAADGGAATLLRLIEYASIEARYQRLPSTSEMLKQAIEMLHREREAVAPTKMV